MSEGNQTSVTTDKCLVKTPHIKIRVLKSGCEMICEPRLLYDAEIWGLVEVGRN
jgi:hypothetical protein